MKILKYVILVLTLLNIPSTVLFYINPALGSLLSYLTYALLIVYFAIEKGGKPNLWLVTLGISYYLFSGLNFYSGEVSAYFILFIKYLIVIFCGSVLVKKITADELFIFLAIGSLSIVIEAFFFANPFGRYGGLFVNPNTGGFIVIMAYTLTFRIKNRNWGLLAQMVLTICGLVTFSRTFIVMWLLTNLIALRISLKNIRVLGIGFALLVAVVLFGELFKLNTIRLKQFSAVINQKEGALEDANEESRTETWSNYYDYIIDKPFTGNGYNAFQAVGLPPGTGVHNSYLLVLGESGVFPFVLFVSFILYLVYNGYRNFKPRPYLLIQSSMLAISLMAFHNFFSFNYVLIITLWIAYQYKSVTPQRRQTEEMQ